MEATQNVLKSAYDSAEKMKEISRPDDVRVVMSAARRMFDRAELLRWEIMEREADAELRDGKHRDFASVSEAMAFLRGGD